MSSPTQRFARTVAAIAAFGIAAGALVGCSTASAAPGEDAASAAEPTGAQTFVDELGREVEIDLPVTAVYTDFQYQAEAVRLVGGGDKIVAHSDATDPANPLNANNKEYWASFADAQSVGAYDEPNWETVVDSGAQVAFVMRNGPWEDAVEKLEPFGIDVFVVTGWDPEVLREFIPVLGEILGTEDQAAEAAALYDDIDATLAEHTEGIPEDERKKVYFEGSTEYSTVVPGSGFHDQIVDAGGENIFGDVNITDDQSAKIHNYPVDPVEIIDRNPDVIIQNTVGGLTAGIEPVDEQELQDAAAAIANRGGWDQITAVQNDDIYVTSNFLWSTLGKKIGSVALAKILYPEEFADVDVDDYFGTWLELQGVEPRPAADYIVKYAG